MSDREASIAEVKQSIVRLKNLIRAYYPYREYAEVDAEMSRLQDEVNALDRKLAWLESQPTKEVA